MLAMVVIVGHRMLALALEPASEAEVVRTAMEFEVQRSQQVWPEPARSGHQCVSNAESGIERRIDLERSEIRLQKTLVVQLDHREALLVLVEVSGVRHGR